MSVNWQWKKQMGTIKCNDRNQNYTLNVYKGNCLCVMTYNYKQDGKKLYDFAGFFNDEEHLKICIGLKKDSGGEFYNLYKDTWKKWKLNTYYKESFTLAKWLTKAGFKVELYYKEIKKR